MTHTHKRANERIIYARDARCLQLARRYRNAAVVLYRCGHVGPRFQDYRTITESNGDLVILIVRNSRPRTVMYRRSDQPLTAEALRVPRVVDISERI